MEYDILLKMGMYLAGLTLCDRELSCKGIGLPNRPFQDGLRVIRALWPVGLRYGLPVLLLDIGGVILIG